MLLGFSNILYKHIQTIAYCHVKVGLTLLHDHADDADADDDDDYLEILQTVSFSGCWRFSHVQTNSKHQKSPKIQINNLPCSNHHFPMFNHHILGLSPKILTISPSKLAQDKETATGSGPGVRWGSTGMQGWRVSMEEPTKMGRFIPQISHKIVA